jgi:hypothetical protein
MKLFITDKPSTQQAINKSLPNIEADGICNLFRFYTFNYKNSEFPSYPQYKYDNNVGFFYPMYHHVEGKVTSGKEFKFHENNYNDFLKYSEICFFLDRHHTDVRSADLFLDHFFGKLKDRYSVTFVWIDNHSTEHIKRQYESRLDYFEAPAIGTGQETARKVYQQLDRYRKGYEIKDYIDFNFNMIMKKFFPTGKRPSDKLLMTRNKIMTLILLQRYSFSDSMESRDVVGREMMELNIGSSASRSEIVSTLVNSKMVTPELFRLTKKAKHFLDTLPVGAMDFDFLAHLQTIEYLHDCTHERKIEAVDSYLSKMFQAYI